MTYVSCFSCYKWVIGSIILACVLLYFISILKLKNKKKIKKNKKEDNKKNE